MFGCYIELIRGLYREIFVEFFCGKFMDQGKEVVHNLLKCEN